MANVLVQSAQAAVTGGTTSAIVFGSNNTLGNFLVCIGRGSGANFGTAPHLSVSDSQGNVWSQVALYEPNTSVGFICWAALNCKAGANTVTVHGNQGGSTFAAASFIIAEYSGVKINSPVVDQLGAIITGTGQNGQAGRVITTGQAELILFFGANETLGPLTPVSYGGGFSAVQDSTHNAFLGHVLNATAGTYSPTFTAGGGSSTWEAFTVSFYEIGGGPSSGSASWLTVANANLLRGSRSH